MSDQLFPTDIAAARTISLVRLSGEIARAVGEIGLFSVEGEVHRAKSVASGRIYFTLRDRVAQVTVVCPSSRVDRCRVVDGERVLVTGRCEWGSERGQLTVRATEVSPVGAGAVAAAIEQARVRLRADGVLDRTRRPLPLLPRRVGVVCGNEAAVKADVLAVRNQRFPNLPVRIEEVIISGPGAVDDILRALQRLDGDPEVDVIVLARGGGDATQLLPFSDESLCRAVAACHTPVVAAIGHEGDRPLVDEVVDLRCGTPSMAMASVIPDAAELGRRVDGYLRRAAETLARRGTLLEMRLERCRPRLALVSMLDRADRRLSRASAALEKRPPIRRVELARRRLAQLRPTDRFYRKVAASEARLAGLVRQGNALSPVRVLQRGYAVVRSNGVVLRSSSQVAEGDSVLIELSEGKLTGVVREGHG